jgi:hypothetical protein
MQKIIFLVIVFFALGATAADELWSCTATKIVGFQYGNNQWNVAKKIPDILHHDNPQLFYVNGKYEFHINNGKISEYCKFREYLEFLDREERVECAGYGVSFVLNLKTKEYASSNIGGISSSIKNGQRGDFLITKTGQCTKRIAN